MFIIIICASLFHQNTDYKPCLLSSRDNRAGHNWMSTHTHSLPCVVCCCCVVAKLCPTLLQPHGLQPTWLLWPWDFPGKNTGVGCHFLVQGDLPHPGIKPASPASPALAGGFFTTEPPGKPPSHELRPTRDTTTSCFWTGARATQGLPRCEQNPSLECPDHRWSRDDILMSRTGHSSVSFLPYSPFMIDFCRVNWSIFAKPQGY